MDQRDPSFALFDEAPVFLSVLEGPELRIVMTNRRVRESPGGDVLAGRTARELYPADNPVLAALARAVSARAAMAEAGQARA